jgi:hypothetical protein
MIESREEDESVQSHRGESGATESISEETEPGAGQGYAGDDGEDAEGANPPTSVEDPHGDPTVSTPEAGGYAGRDPKTDMPAMPSVPESQDDKLSHDAAPDPDAPEQTGSDD